MPLNSLLKQKSVSGYWLSKRSGISQSTISAWGTGKRDPLGMSLRNAKAISTALNVDLNTLYDYLDDENPSYD